MTKPGVENQRHGDGLAQRAAQAEHRRGDDPGPAERQHRGADHLPLRGTQRPCGVDGLPRHLQEDLAAHRGDDRDDHDRQHDPGDQQRLAELAGGGGGLVVEDRDPAEIHRQPLLEALGVRDQEVQPPHAEHQRRHRRQQVDHRTERGRRPPGGVVRDEQRDPDRDRHPDQQRDERGHHGAEEHRRHPEERRRRLRVPRSGW